MGTPKITQPFIDDRVNDMDWYSFRQHLEKQDKTFFSGLKVPERD
jgi:hypothetical protein